MKFKKKTTAVVMGLTVAAALTACGSSGTQDAGGSQTADRGEYDLKNLNFKGRLQMICQKCAGNMKKSLV